MNEEDQLMLRQAGVLHADGGVAVDDANEDEEAFEDMNMF